MGQRGGWQKGMTGRKQNGTGMQARVARVRFMGGAFGQCHASGKLLWVLYSVDFNILVKYH